MKVTSRPALAGRSVCVCVLSLLACSSAPGASWQAQGDGAVPPSTQDAGGSTADATTRGGGPSGSDAGTTAPPADDGGATDSAAGDDAGGVTDAAGAAGDDSGATDGGAADGGTGAPTHTGCAGGKPATSIKDCMLPAVKNGGFSMAGMILWCSSIIKVGGTYHMFASRWPSSFGIGGWTTQSECVRATSPTLEGPYTFQEVVLQKRPNNWDNTRVHNVKIVQAGSTYLIYYINTANETGYAYSDSITGPWTRLNMPVMTVSNPAPLVRADLSMYVFGRLAVNGVNRGIAFTAPTYQGPYTVVANGANLLPNNYQLEDPTIWWANNQYNIVLNDWQGLATGVFKNGAQYSSKDGVQYSLVTHDSIFTKAVTYDDGSTETCTRRERPFVYAENGEALALTTSCLTPGGDSHVVLQPVDHYVPAN
jgi:hypothetical protein